MNEIPPKNWKSPCGRFRISRSNIGFNLWDEESGEMTSWRQFLVKDFDSNEAAFEAAKEFAIKSISENT